MYNIMLLFEMVAVSKRMIRENQNCDNTGEQTEYFCQDKNGIQFYIAYMEPMSTTYVVI